MTVNEEALGFRLLVGQKKQFEEFTLGSGKMSDEQFYHNFLCLVKLEVF